MSDPRPSLARVTFLGFRADVLNAISLAVGSVLVARGLGAEDRGLFFLAFLAATLVAMLADLGMSTTSIVYGANRELPPRQLHGIAALFGVAGGLFAAVVLLPLEGFWTESVLNGLDTTLLVLLCVGVAPQLYGQILTALLTGMGHVPEVSAMRIVQAFAYPVLVGAGSFTGDPAWALAAWLATVTLFGAGLSVYAFRYAGAPALPAASTLRRALSFGSRSWIGTLSFQGFLRVDVFFLGARSGPRAVGIYSLSSLVAERIGLVSHAIYGAVASPMGRGGEEAAQLTASALRLMLTVLVPVAIVLGLVAIPGFAFVFGDDFEAGVTPFQLLLPGTVSLALWSVVALYIVSALRRPGTTTLIQGGMLLLSLPLYYVAIEASGMNGAAIVASATYVSVLAAGVIVLVRSSGVRLRDLVPGPGEPVRLLRLVRQSLRRSQNAVGA